MDTIPPREKWYRIPEREKKSVKKSPASLPVNTFIRADRIVVRAGYYIEPLDMPLDLLNELIIKAIPLPLSDVYDFLSVLGFVGFGDVINTDLVPARLKVLKDYYSLPPFKKLVYKERGRWVSAQTDMLPVETRNLRTLWYVDENFSGFVNGRKIKLIGRRIPGGMYGGWEYYEYEPPTFSESNRQALYCVGSWRYGLEQTKKNGLLGFSPYFYNYYVHPDDVREVLPSPF